MGMLTIVRNDGGESVTLEKTDSGDSKASRVVALLLIYASLATVPGRDDCRVSKAYLLLRSRLTYPRQDRKLCRGTNVRTTSLKPRTSKTQ